MISQSESVIYINVMTHFYDICSSIALPMYWFNDRSLSKNENRSWTVPFIASMRIVSKLRHVWWTMFDDILPHRFTISKAD